MSTRRKRRVRRALRVLAAAVAVLAAAPPSGAATITCRIADRAVLLELDATSEEERGDRLARLAGAIEIPPDVSGIAKRRLPLGTEAVAQFKASVGELWLRLHLTSTDPLDAGFIDLTIDARRSGARGPFIGRYSLAGGGGERRLTGAVRCEVARP